MTSVSHSKMRSQNIKDTVETKEKEAASEAEIRTVQDVFLAEIEDEKQPDPDQANEDWVSMKDLDLKLEKGLLKADAHASSGNETQLRSLANESKIASLTSEMEKILARVEDGGGDFDVDAQRQRQEQEQQRQAQEQKQQSSLSSLQRSYEEKLREMGSRMEANKVRLSKQHECEAKLEAFVQTKMECRLKLQQKQTSLALEKKNFSEYQQNMEHILMKMAHTNSSENSENNDAQTELIKSIRREMEASMQSKMTNMEEKLNEEISVCKEDIASVESKEREMSLEIGQMKEELEQEMECMNVRMTDVENTMESREHMIASLDDSIAKLINVNEHDLYIEEQIMRIKNNVAHKTGCESHLQFIQQVIKRVSLVFFDAQLFVAHNNRNNSNSHAGAADIPVCQGIRNIYGTHGTDEHMPVFVENISDFEVRFGHDSHSHGNNGKQFGTLFAIELLTQHCRKHEKNNTKATATTNGNGNENENDIVGHQIRDYCHHLLVVLSSGCASQVLQLISSAGTLESSTRFHANRDTLKFVQIMAVMACYPPPLFLFKKHKQKFFPFTNKSMVLNALQQYYQARGCGRSTASASASAVFVERILQTHAQSHSNTLLIANNNEQQNINQCKTEQAASGISAHRERTFVNRHMHAFADNNLQKSKAFFLFLWLFWVFGQTKLVLLLFLLFGWFCL